MRSNINPQFFLQNTQRLQLSNSVLTKKNADTDMTITLPISSHVIQFQDAQFQAFFMRTYNFSSHSHTLFASIINVSYQNLQSTPFGGVRLEGQKSLCEGVHSSFSTRLLSCEMGLPLKIRCSVSL